LSVRSAAITPKLLSVEQLQKAGAADQWRETRGEPENLGTYAKPDEMEIARGVIHDYIGEVSVVEDASGVYGLVRMCNGPGYESGAQERTSILRCGIEVWRPGARI